MVTEKPFGLGEIYKPLLHPPIRTNVHIDFLVVVDGDRL